MIVMKVLGILWVNKPARSAADFGEIMKTENVERKPGYTQVCVWEGANVGLDKVAEFEEVVLLKEGARVQYLEEITTYPLYFEDDEYDGRVSYEGDMQRTDLFFAVHDDDINTFATRRLMMGVRWIEDVYWDMNYQRGDYPCRVKEYCTWDPYNMKNDMLMTLANLVPSTMGHYPTICHVLPDRDFLK
jgi:hypothetical protein